MFLYDDDDDDDDDHRRRAVSYIRYVLITGVLISDIYCIIFGFEWLMSKNIVILQEDSSK